MQTKKLYTRNTIARNIKHLGNGVLEIRRYQDGNLRMVAFWLFFICLFFFVKDMIVKKNTDWPYQSAYFYARYRDVDRFLHKNEIIEKDWAELNELYKIPTYEEALAEAKSRYKYGVAYEAGSIIERAEESAAKRESKEQHDKRLSKLYKKNLTQGIFGLSIPLILLIIAGYPRFRPLRIDSKRRLVYWGAEFDFYIMRLPMMTETRYPPQSLNILQPRAFCPALRPSGQEALMLTIPHESDPEQAKNIDLGIFRPTAANQYLQIEAFLNDFLACDNPEEKYAEYFKKESIIASDFFNLFYQFRLFPQFGYNDKMVERKIQAFLQRET